MYSTGIAYLLWLISGFGVLGFHRLYLNKWITGLLFMFTGGLGGFGAFYDLITLSIQVREANLRLAYREAIDGRYAPKEPRHFTNDFKTSMRDEIKKDSLERVILKTANVDMLTQPAPAILFNQAVHDLLQGNAVQGIIRLLLTHNMYVFLSLGKFYFNLFRLNDRPQPCVV